VLGPEHPETAQTLTTLALLHHEQRRYSDVEPLYRRALAINENVLGPEHPDIATSLSYLAGLYYQQGR
jgi:hypothetical protein